MYEIGAPLYTLYRFHERENPILQIRLINTVFIRRLLLGTSFAQQNSIQRSSRAKGLNKGRQEGETGTNEL